MTTPSITWEAALSILTKSSQHKCTVRLLDTVIYTDDSTEWEWYYTTKNGVISKKKKDKTKVEDIVTRFCRFASSNPNNTSGIVGVTSATPTGTPTYLTADQLHVCLSNQGQGEVPSWIRVYLRPHGGVDQTFLATYLSSRNSLQYSVATAFGKESSDISSIANGTFACDQVSVFMNDLRRCLQEGSNITVSRMTAEFIIDDNSHVWLSRILNLQIGSQIDECANSPDEVSRDTSQSILPGLPPRTTSSQGGRGVMENTLQRVVLKEGSCLRCSLGPEDLPGLRAWVLTGMYGASSNDWCVDLHQYRAVIAPSPDLQDLRQSRSDQRRGISPLFAALLERGDGMLSGSVDIDDEEDFMERWSTLYTQAVAANVSRHSSAEVTACGNCFAICAKLKSLVDVGFRATGKKVKAVVSDDDEADCDRPSSETRIHRSKKGGNSDQPADSAAAVNRVRSSPALPSHHPEHTRDLDSQTDTASVSVLSMDSSRSSKHAQGNLSNLKKRQRLKKGAKTNASSAKKGGDVVKNSSPNIDMLAKFAAERERHRQLMEGENSYFSEASNDGRMKPPSPSQYQPPAAPSSSQKTVAVQKGKKRASGNGVMTDDERRLMELERVAAAASAQSQLNSFGSMSSVESFKKFGTPTNTFSGSEEEFMLRQAGIGETSHLRNVDEAHSVGRVGAQLTKPSFDHEAISKLQEHISAQDKKIMALENTIREKDRELDKYDKKYGDLNKKFVEFRAEAFDERDNMKLEYETQILQMKESHAKHMASFAKKDKQAIASDGEKHESGGEVGDSRGMNALVQQLEILRAENKAVAERAAAERKTMHTEFSLKLLNSEKVHNEAAQRYKGTISSLEDNIVRISNEIETLTTKCASLTEHNKQLDSSRIEALNTQQKLRADLKSMQGSLASSYRLESSQSIGIGVDADTAIKLSEAKAEAKVRQLTNQVEFLKSQLAAELASVEEMRSVCESAKEKAEFMKSDFRERMAEAERQRIADVEAAEVRTEARYEIRMNELASLQAKFASIQSQMQEAFNDSEAAKQREELAKNSSAKAQAQVQIMRTEVDQLRRTVNELREKSDGNTGTDTEVNKHSQESMMRRLDNERQYLKSQLSSEITLKNELQNTLSHCQKQLADIQRQWGDDVDAMRESKRLSEQESIQIEQRMTQKITLLHSENERNKSQLEDMKEGYVKMREQLRSEQMAMENARAVNTRLTEELEDAKDEIKTMKAQEARTAQMFQEQLAAVTLSMQEMEEAKTTIINGLREELSRQFMENSEAQKQSIVLKRKVQDEKFGLSRKVEAVRLYNGIVRWHSNNLGRHFRKWQKNAALVTAASQFRSKLKQILKRKEEDYEKDKEYAIHKAHTDCNLDWQEKVEGREKEFKQQMDSTVERYEEIRAEDVKKNDARTQQLLDERDVMWEDRLDALKEEHAATLEDEHLAHEKSMNDLRAKFRDEMARQIGMLQEQAKSDRSQAITETTKELTDKFEQQRTDLEDSHYDKIRSIDQRHVEEISQLQNAHKNDKVELCKKLGSEYDIKEADIRREFAREISELESRKEDERQKAIEDCLVEAEKVLSETREDAHVATEERLRLMRELWEEELVEKMKAKDQELEALIASRLEEVNFAAADLKQKAVKLETTKWQQVLKEAERKFALEVQQARSKGFADCEKKFKSEIQIAADDNARKIIVAEDKNREILNELKREQSEAMEKLINDHELLIAKREEEAKECARQDVEAGMQSHIDALVAQARQEADDIWMEKMAKEESRLEQLKSDMSRMTYVHAEAKRELQTHIDTLELRLQQKEASCDEIVRKLQQQMDRDKEKFLSNQEKLKRTMTADFNESKDDALVTAKNVWEQETLRRIKDAKEELQEQLDLQMSELQEENDRLISSLETAMDELRKEKVALSDELESTTTKLENCEDSLYDAQQAYAKLQKINAINMWKGTAKSMAMRSYFQKEIEHVESEAESNMALLQQESKEKLEDLIMLTFRLSNLIVDTEKMRARLNSALTTYKTDVLVEKRTSIRLFEKELSRLGEEKELLEQQRDVMEDEVQELEEQVRDVEEQIREHNRSSSVMSNGRINVAHARKKKRYDTELERMLDLIEQKRMQMADMDDRIERIVTQKNEKEADLVDVEKALVVVLIEQQRLVLSQVEEAKSIEEKGKMLVKMSVVPWPPPANPDHTDVANVLVTARKKH